MTRPEIAAIKDVLEVWFTTKYHCIVSFMMTPAHVLRLLSMPEPEKVNPLVLPWQ